MQRARSDEICRWGQCLLFHNLGHYMQFWESTLNMMDASIRNKKCERNNNNNGDEEINSPLPFRPAFIYLSQPRPGGGPSPNTPSRGVAVAVLVPQLGAGLDMGGRCGSSGARGDEAAGSIWKATNAGTAGAAPSLLGQAAEPTATGTGSRGVPVMQLDPVCGGDDTSGKGLCIRGCGRGGTGWLGQVGLFLFLFRDHGLCLVVALPSHPTASSDTSS